MDVSDIVLLQHEQQELQPPMGRRWPKLPDTLTNRCLPHSNGCWITNFYTSLGRESHLISQQLMSRWGGVNKHEKWHMSACSTLFKDKSWLSSPSTSSTTTKSDVKLKLPSWKPWFTGIIKIKKQVSPVAYKLGLPSISSNFPCLITQTCCLLCPKPGTQSWATISIGDISCLHASSLQAMVQCHVIPVD